MDENFSARHRLMLEEDLTSNFTMLSDGNAVN